jgi:hypothetical protein
MKFPLSALLATGAIPAVSFPTDSRYCGSSTITYMTPDGQCITYLARRFVPQPGSPNFATVAKHTVKQGDRLDLLAVNYLGDPLLFWLICDANGAIRPEDLVDEENIGQSLNITLPQGVPGGTSA